MCVCVYECVCVCVCMSECVCVNAHVCACVCLLKSGAAHGKYVGNVHNYVNFS